MVKSDLAVANGKAVGALYGVETIGFSSPDQERELTMNLLGDEVEFRVR